MGEAHHRELSFLRPALRKAKRKTAKSIKLQKRSESFNRPTRTPASLAGAPFRPAISATLSPTFSLPLRLCADSLSSIEVCICFPLLWFPHYSFHTYIYAHNHVPYSFLENNSERGGRVREETAPMCAPLLSIISSPSSCRNHPPSKSKSSPSALAPTPDFSALRPPLSPPL